MNTSYSRRRMEPARKKRALESLIEDEEKRGKELEQKHDSRKQKLDEILLTFDKLTVKEKIWVLNPEERELLGALPGEIKELQQEIKDLEEKIGEHGIYRRALEDNISILEGTE